MRLAFYAPLKAPTHRVPSGDRRMAQLLVAALGRAGHDVDLACSLRSYDRGDPERQARLGALGGRIAARLLGRLRGRPLSQRPRAWITYHLYYKAPDHLGPVIARHLAIPYIVVEASVAAKRAAGPWAAGHAAVVAALGRADTVVSLNAADDAGVRACLPSGARCVPLTPFLDAGPFRAAARTRAASRLAAARAYGLPAGEPWLIAVAMMRPGDKLASYRVLGAALATVLDRPWRLLVVGDGEARGAVASALAPLGQRVAFAGALAAEALPATLAAADLCVWPAVNEAYGMALLEAQAGGLPVVAGASGGVGVIVAHGRTGLLTPPGDPDAFAAAVRNLLEDEAKRRAFAAAAQAKVMAAHDLPQASAALDRIVRDALGERA